MTTHLLTVSRIKHLVPKLFVPDLDAYLEYKHKMAPGARFELALSLLTVKRTTKYASLEHKMERNIGLAPILFLWKRNVLAVEH